MASLTVTQRRSSNGCNQRQLDTLRSLGLRRIGQSVEIGDSAQARGMLHAVRHLVEVGEPDGASGAASKPAGAKRSQPKATAAKAAEAKPAKAKPAKAVKAAGGGDSGEEPSA